MKRTFLTFLSICALCFNVYAKDEAILDSKYIKIGVVTNDWNNQLGSDPNIRHIGQCSDNPDFLTIGRQVLDALLCRDYDGLHIDKLWDQALSNVVIEEQELALYDASAEYLDVLKKDISRQLLKANYIIITKKVKEENALGTPVDYCYWYVYYVNITDDVINQAFMNWYSLNDYDKINVDVNMVAMGKIKQEKRDQLLLYIAKKVPAFALRAPIESRHPTYCRLNSSQGVKKRDVAYLYGIRKASTGQYVSRRKGVALISNVDPKHSRLFSIDGATPSVKNGDIVVIRPTRTNSSISLMGEFTFGNDPRYGGCLLYDYRIATSKIGISHYILGRFGYYTYAREPSNMYYQYLITEEDPRPKNPISPRLWGLDYSVGYGAGFAFLNCLELTPYITLGMISAHASNYDSSKGRVVRFDGVKEGNYIYENMPNGMQTVKITFGARLTISIYYPLQVVIGTNYDINAGIDSHTYELSDIMFHHTFNRLNLNVGFRYNL